MERLRRVPVSRSAVAFALLLGGAACGGDGRTPLEVRTGFPDELRAEVERSFESAHPDVDVRFSDASADISLAQLRSVDTAPFDVWWGAPALALQKAADEALLKPLRRATPIDTVRWRPVLTTPFVIAFDRTVVPLAEAPLDWIDLFHYRWYDDLRLLDPGRTAEGAYFAGAMIVEALRDDDDLDRGFDWLDRLDEQVDAYAADVDELVRALGAGEALVAILPRADAEVARHGDAPWLHYRLPESGSPVLVLGVGITATTGQRATARAFVEHLGTDEVATASKLYTRWEPAQGEVDASRLPPDFELEQPWTGYRPAVDTLAAELDGWMARWEVDVHAR